MTTEQQSESMGAVVIGASAGAVTALLEVLPALAPDYPLPVLIVVHVHPNSDGTLAALLSERSRIAVKEAEDKEPIQPGTVYLAPANYHMLVEPTFELSLSSEEPVLFSRPSIDVLFETAADAYGSSLAGVVLTGANADGAQGLRAVERAGGRVYVQSPDEAEEETMPRAALAACPAR